jgi:beta-galactosidase
VIVTEVWQGVEGGPEVRHTCRTRATGPGTWEFAHIVEVPEELADLPRVGVRFTLPAGFERVRWFGRGPHENYPDRRASARLGMWESRVDEMPYLVPQEFGLRTDCRWIGLSGAGRRLTITPTNGVLHCSATHHTSEQLYAAADLPSLERLAGLAVHLDVAHRGLGTASCGPDVLERYRLTAGTYRWGYAVHAARE